LRLSRPALVFRAFLTVKQAKDWGNIMLALYERDGWALVDDSHTEKVPPPPPSHAAASVPSSVSSSAPPPSHIQLPGSTSSNVFKYNVFII